MNEFTKIMITYAVIAVVWYVVQTIGCLGVFKKTESKKALAFIPLLREKELFDISMKDQKAGTIWLVLAVVGLVGFFGGSFTQIQILAWVGFISLILAIFLSIYRNYREAKAFGRGAGTAVILTLFDPLGNLIIGRSFSEYKGRK
ncbi:MAG: DUF5684 domain-containing protein [Bulleidia sp.]